MKKIKMSLLAVAAILGVGSAIAGSTIAGDRYVKNPIGNGYTLISTTAYAQGTCVAGGTVCSYLVQTSAALPGSLIDKAELQKLQRAHRIVARPNVKDPQAQVFLPQP